MSPNFQNHNTKLLFTIVFTLFSCFYISTNCCAQSKQQNDTGQKHGFILTELYRDFEYLLFEPDFYMIVGGVAVSPGLFKQSFRSEEPEFTEMWANEGADRFFESGEIFGSGMFQGLASVSLYSLGWIAGDSKMENLGSDLLRAHAINGILTGSLKAAVNRTRPDGHPYSYPSGHTSSAFTSAGVIFHDLGPKYGVPALILASYVGLSRLQENKHYLSDVIAGAVLGSYVSFKVTHRDNRKRGMSFSPAVIDDAPGLSLSLRF